MRQPNAEERALLEQRFAVLQAARAAHEEAQHLFSRATAWAAENCGVPVDVYLMPESGMVWGKAMPDGKLAPLVIVEEG